MCCIAACKNDGVHYRNSTEILAGHIEKQEMEMKRKLEMETAESSKILWLTSVAVQVFVFLQPTCFIHIRPEIASFL